MSCIKFVKNDISLSPTILSLTSHPFVFSSFKQDYYTSSSEEPLPWTRKRGSSLAEPWTRNGSSNVAWRSQLRPNEDISPASALHHPNKLHRWSIERDVCTIRSMFYSQSRRSDSFNVSTGDAVSSVATHIICDTQLPRPPRRRLTTTPAASSETGACIRRFH